MRKGEATRLRVIDEAARQAALKGLMGVSLGDLAAAVGISKSGLFKHFDSKDAMQQAVIEQVMDHFATFVWGPAKGVERGRARLELIFDRWLDWAEHEWPRSGCPITAFSVELDDQPGELRDLFQTRLQGWRKTVVREFRALGDPPLSEAEAQAAYFQMKSFILGHSDARRMMGDDDARRSAHAAFDGLLERTARLSA
jgi:AcrR family transcriptional regulator